MDHSFENRYEIFSLVQPDLNKRAREAGKAFVYPDLTQWFIDQWREEGYSLIRSRYDEIIKLAPKYEDVKM